jgi:hypothetical protein
MSIAGDNGTTSNGPDWSSSDDRVPPRYVVFPALVLGLGVHGERVARRLARRVQGEDPSLLRIVQVGSLSQDGTTVRLRIARGGTGDRDQVEVTAPDLSTALHEEDGMVPLRLRTLCDSVGVHEDLQRLAEHGYETFAQDEPIRVRVYLVADFNEADLVDAMQTVAEQLSESLSGCGTLTMTALYVDREGIASHPAAIASEGLHSPFHRVYSTSRIKQDGYLAANHSELETAHCLFLQSMVLSDAERVLNESVPGGGSLATFGIAGLSIGTQEMVDWLQARLARRVIREGYLAPPPEDETGPEGRTEEVRLRTGWSDAMRGLSSRQATIVADDGLPQVALPEKSPLPTWCEHEIDRRLADSTSSGTPTPDLSEASIASPPLAQLFISLRERAAQAETALEADMRNRLHDEHLALLPGCLEHTSNVLNQWREALKEEANKLGPEIPQKGNPDDTVDTWLNAELDRIVDRIRTMKPPPWLVLILAIAALGVLGGFVGGLAFGVSWIVFGASVVLLAALIGVTRRVMRFMRRRLRRKLMYHLLKDLEARLGEWLRVPTHETLERLIAWLESVSSSTSNLRTVFEAMARRYDDLGEQPQAAESCFLEHILVAPERCRAQYSDVSLDELLTANEIRSLPARLVLPLTEAAQDQASIGSVDPDAVEESLLRGVGVAARSHILPILLASLSDLVARTAGEESSGANHGGAYDRVMERLRNRALPLHRLGKELPSRNGKHHEAHGDLQVLELETQSESLLVNLLLIADGESGWSQAAAEHTGSPDYLRRVSYANDHMVVYIRTVYGMVAAPAQLPVTERAAKPLPSAV